MSDHQELLDRKRELLVMLRRHRSLELRTCFDPMNPDSRPTPKQQEVLEAIRESLFVYVKGGNQSGKSSLGARLVSWIYQRQCPYLDIEAMWPGEPMLILVVGRLQNQVEELWERKIKPFLTPEEWQENRQGGSLQYVINKKTGSKIVFASHANNDSQEKLQSYTCHFVWLDELTDRLGVIEELQRRVQAKRGRMILTFTPKIRAESVRKFLETPTPYSKSFSISMLDNPVYADRHDELLSQINAMPEAARNTILYGEWYVGEKAVFFYDPSQHDEDPVGYSTLWPHVVSVDPAASGLMGLSVWAAPYDGAHTWYCVKAEYIKGGAPSDLIALVEAKTAQYPNILFRVCDTHESWYLKEAAKQRISYRVVDHKHGRKKELIATLNQALASGRIKLTREAKELASELASAQWSDKIDDRIVNASSYHVADTAQYFADALPRIKTAEPQHLTFDHQLYLANKDRLAKEAARAAPKSERQSWRIVARGGNVWRKR